jgi:hypothetical protein
VTMSIQNRQWILRGGFLRARLTDRLPESPFSQPSLCVRTPPLSTASNVGLIVHATYETPFEAMAQIKDYVAFYPDRVDEIS